MKKVLLILTILFAFNVSPALAKTAPVQILQDFSLSNPSDTLLIKVLSNLRLNKETMLFDGFYVLGQISKVSDSSVMFTPVKYQNFHNEVFDITDNFPAKMLKVLEGTLQNGVIPKNSKLLFDFINADDNAQEEIGNKPVDIPEGGLSSFVNQTPPVLYDGSIPQTMKEFPGIKLNTFDNSSNFNIPRKLMVETEKKNSNINYLKK